MSTERLQRFLVGFETTILPVMREDKTGLVYVISQSLAEDPLVQQIAHLKKGSGASRGVFMGVEVRTMADFRAEDYRA